MSDNLIHGKNITKPNKSRMGNANINDGVKDTFYLVARRSRRHSAASQYSNHSLGKLKSIEAIRQQGV